jgi:cyclic GMP-AMP synthase DncV-like protein
MTRSMNPLSALLAGSVDLLDIPPHLRDLVVARYQDVGDFLAHNGGTLCDIYPQGSFLLGTAIQPPRETEYDIDLVFCDGISKDDTTQAELKERVGDMLEAYYAHKTGADNAPDDFREKRRCWTLSYSRQGFHLDVLPAVIDAGFARSQNAILLTDTKLRPWQHANPKDYAIWFRTRSEEMRRKIAASAHAENVADVPNWAVRSTLQRLVQVLKWHCYLDFAEDVDNRPPSILITTLAAHAYRGQDDLGQALLEVIDNMPNYIRKINGRWQVVNPAQPKENFADKWNEPDTAHRRQQFNRWLRKVQRDLEIAYESQASGIDVLVDRLGTTFDRRILAKSAANWARTTVDFRTQGRLGITRGIGTLVIGSGRASPRHDFYGRDGA